MSGDLKGLIQFGFDVLSVSVSAKTKKILVQLGNAIARTKDTNNAEFVQHVGFASIPSKPDGGEAAAQAFVVRQGDRDLVLGSQDLRCFELYGNLTYGETCMYAGGEDANAQARILLKKNGSINLYTRVGNTKTGTGMCIIVNPDDDSISIVNSKGNGIIINGDGVKITSGKAAITLGADGTAKMIGTGAAQVDGTSITLGSIAVPVANSVCVGPAGIAAVASTKVFAALA